MAIHSRVGAGETATVDIKNTVTGEWQPLPFVKENGVWKAALDKVLTDVMEKEKKAIQSSNTNALPSNKENLPKLPVNKPAENKK